jgi:NAD(P)-dependent dehydrogenase (short-subunit alcohol dehydrogenase family)
VTATISVADRVVLVTGASRGLGRAMALGLLAAGARVLLASTGPSKALEATLTEASALAPPSRYATAFGDLREPEACEGVAAQAVSTFGRLDALINNAAVPNQGEGPRFWDISPDDWRRIARTNCDTVFFMSRCVAPIMMRQGGGKIVNVSTSGRTMARARYTPYGPSKAFIEACTRAWAGELEGSGVTMNVLLPGGVVDTAADVTGVAAQGRSFLQASVMAAPILWLVSGASDGVTGRRFVAARWDETLPLAQRIEAACEDGAPEPRIL